MKTLAKVCILCLAWIGTTVASVAPDTITILHFNDTHSNLAPIGPRDAALHGTLGGIARAATLIGMTRAENPKSLVLHAGDSFIGDLFFNTSFGIAEFSFLKALGFDAMAVGNHEFDLTPAVLQMALDSAFSGGGFPLLSANLDLSNDTVQSLKKYIHPYLIRDLGNSRIGIFGLTTPSTMLLSQPLPAVALSDVAGIAGAMIDTLKTHGCNVIILLSHLGDAADQDLARSVSGIHLIVGGHDHLSHPTPVPIRTPNGDTTLVVQANAFYLNAGRMRLVVSPGTVRMLSYEYLTLDSSIPEHPTTAAMVEGLESQIEAQYGPLFTGRIGYARADFDEVATNLIGNGSKDTPVGNLVTDAFRACTKTEVALEVGGSTAEPIWHGPIVPADLFRVVGYGFNMENGLGYHLATMKMAGAAIVAGIELGLAQAEADDEFFSQVSGMTYAYDSHRPVGSRLAAATVGGQPLDPERLYTVTANEFVPLVLASYQIPFSDLHVCSGDTTEFQVLAAYVQVQDTITPVHRNGVVSAVHAASATAPATFALHQNYPNPFNPTTTIAFDLPRATHVRLSVFDLSGRLVSTLVDAAVPAGSHRVTWNARGLATGIYFLRMNAGGSVELRKMILMK